MNRSAVLLLAITLLLGASACAGSDSSAGSVSTRGQWCDLAREVDEQFELADSGEQDFEASQATYASLVADIERLEGGLEHVDDEARGAVGASLAGAREIAALIADAEDAEAAGAAAEAHFAELEEPAGAEEAAAWILDNCDVDIDG